MEMMYYRKIPRISYKDHVTNEEVRAKFQQAIGPHDDLTIVKRRKLQWYGFATSFLHFSLFSTALWDLPDSRPVHSLMLSSHLFLCLPCLLPPFTVPCKMVLARPD